MKKLKTEKGITLIALIITIIVMLILVGVSVSVALNGGLFSTAKQATSKTQLEKDKELLLSIVMGAINNNGTVELEKLNTLIRTSDSFQVTDKNWRYKSIKSGNMFRVFSNGTITLVDGENQVIEKEISGSYIMLTDVSEDLHNLEIALTSDIITDFSGVKLKRTGQNLLNVDELTAKNNGNGRDALVDNGNGTYTMTRKEDTRVTQIVDIFIPANTTFRVSANLIEQSELISDDINELRVLLKGANGEEKHTYLREIDSSQTNKDIRYHELSTDFDVTSITFYMIDTLAVGEEITFNELQVAIKADDIFSYTPYTEQIVTANSNGTVTGLTSVSPFMMITTDSNDVEIKCKYHKQIPEYDLTGKKIVNLGDSIFDDNIAPNDISTQLANLTNATVYNGGFPGARMSWNTDNLIAFSMHSLADSIANKDFQVQENAINSDTTIPEAYADALDRLENINFEEVDIVTIAFGTNDFSAARPLENASDKYDKQSFAGALRYSIETISEAYPNIDIVLCTPIYRFWLDDNNEFLYDSETYVLNEQKLTQFVQKEKEIGAEYGLLVIDNYYNSGINANNRSQYFTATDGTHPNKEGLKLMAINIAKELYEEFK